MPYRTILKTALLAAAGISLLLFLILNFYTTTSQTKASPPSNTQYRRIVHIDNTSNNSPLTDYQVMLTLDTQSLISQGKLQSQCQDIRFLDSDDNTNLNYWIESEGSNGCNTASTRIWVKVPQINANSRKTIYLYYGDTALAAASSEQNTFIFFDDFDNFNSSVWTSTNGASGYSISGGKITVTSGAIYTNTTIGTNPGQMIEAQVTWLNEGSQSGLMIANQQGTASGNSTSAALSYVLRGAPPSGSDYLYGLAARGNSASYNTADPNNRLNTAFSENTKYIIGSGMDTSNLRFFVNRSVDNGLQSPYNAWLNSHNYYLWLGYFSGSNAGTVDISDLRVDWVIVRKYTQNAPTTTVLSETASNQKKSLRFYGGGVNAPDADRVKISINNPERPIDVSNDFTLEFWMKALNSENTPNQNKPTCTNGPSVEWIYGNTIFDRDIYGDGDYGDWGVSLYGGVISFGVSVGTNNRTLCGTTIVANNQWRHIAVTRSSTGTMSIFVDGQLDATTSNGPTGDMSYRNNRSTSYPNSDPYLVIGAEKHDAGSDYPSFSGFIDEVRISNTVRYTNSFTAPSAPFAPDSNTVALYHFDEGSGTTANETSGTQNGPSDGTINVGGNPSGPVWSNDQPFSDPEPTPTPTPYPQNYYHVLLAGQSLATGYDGAPALTTTQPYNNVKLNGAGTAFVSLIEDEDADDNLPSTNVESPASALGNTITALTGGTRRMVVTKNAIPGATYAQLKKNGSTSAYSNGITQITNAKSVANGLGYGLSAVAVALIHGPANFSDGLNYRNMLNEWQSDYNADIKNATGQTENVPMFIDQSSNFTAYNYSSSDLVQAQYLEAKENSNIYLIGPRYHFTYAADNIHIPNTGYRWLGEYYGKAISRVLNGESITALTPAEIVRRENVITARFNVPHEPLVFDTTNVLLKSNYGFEYTDNNNPPSISGVSLLGTDSVRITLASTPSGLNQKLRYAYTGTAGARPGADSSGSARGNLRDSDNTTSLYGNNLYNWAVHFQEDITEDSTPPLISTTPTIISNASGFQVSWSTNEASSSQVRYGVFSASNSNTETNISPRVTSHSSNVSSLLPCTTYFVRARSEDLAGNSVLSTETEATTTGCLGSASVENFKTSSAPTNTNTAIELKSGELGLELTVPAGYSTTQLRFQVHKLDKQSVIQQTGSPSGKSALNYIYNLKALQDETNSVSSFNENISISISYGNNDLDGVEESSLAIYRWDGSNWQELSQCTKDYPSKKITCQTSQFSVFGLFGSSTTNQTSSLSSSGSQSCASIPPSGRQVWLYGAIPASQSSLLLHFVPSAAPITKMAVAYGTLPGKYTFGAEFDANSSTYTYEIGHLSPNIKYYFRVLPINSCAPGEWSNEIAGVIRVTDTFKSLNYTQTSNEPLTKEESKNKKDSPEAPSPNASLEEDITVSEEDGLSNQPSDYQNSGQKINDPSFRVTLIIAISTLSLTIGFFVIKLLIARG